MGCNVGNRERGDGGIGVAGVGWRVPLTTAAVSSVAGGGSWCGPGWVVLLATAARLPLACAGPFAPASFC